MANNEHQFESDIEALMTGELGWSKARKLGAAAPSTEHSEKALDLATLVKFVKASQPREWAFFVKACSGLDPEREFYKKFEDAVATEGMIDVLITLVSSPKGFEITTVFLKALSSGRFILSKYLGEIKENVSHSLAPRASILRLSFRSNTCLGVS